MKRKYLPILTYTSCRYSYEAFGKTTLDTENIIEIEFLFNKKRLYYTANHNYDKFSGCKGFGVLINKN